MTLKIFLTTAMIAASVAVASELPGAGAPGEPTLAAVASASAGGLITTTYQRPDGVGVMTVLDSGKRWMAVYHLPDDGTIRLVSSRPIGPDMTLTLNATEPTPSQIERMGTGR